MMQPSLEQTDLAQPAPPKIVELAIVFGLIHSGWTLEQYLIDAVKNMGYETLSLWAVQGSGKSTRMLQMAHWIYKDWDLALKSFEFKPSMVVKRLRSVGLGHRMPCLCWDDIGVYYPSSTFKTDIKQYQAIDSSWAAIRTRCSVIMTTIPLIDRLAKNIKDNVTFEIFMGRNQMEMINRVFHLPGIGTLESNFFKVGIERPKQFDLYKVPRDVFKQYWEMRETLTEEALENLDRVTDPEDTEGYTSVLQAARDLRISPNTLQQMISRGIVGGRKIKGRLHVLNDDLKLLQETEQVKGRKQAAHIA